MAKPTTTFHEHLLASTHRDDALGDLAKKYKYAIDSGSHPAVRDHRQLHRILSREHADPEMHAAVDALHHDHDLDCLCTEEIGHETTDGNTFFRDYGHIFRDWGGVQITEDNETGEPFYTVSLVVGGSFIREDAEKTASYVRGYLNHVVIP